MSEEGKLVAAYIVAAHVPKLLYSWSCELWPAFVADKPAAADIVAAPILKLCML